MSDVPEAVLQECLDLVEQGESIEQILARYPEQAGALRPFLETAVQLTTLAPQPSLAAKQKSQQAFLAHAASLKTEPIRPSPWYRMRQLLLPLVALGVVLILFVTMAVSVSASAIPGDVLYPVKRLVEDVRLNRTSDPEAVVALTEQYREERIREVQALLRTGRTAEVAFEGEINAIQPEEWMVATINVTLNAATSIEGRPQVGEIARVNGRTEDGEFIASFIEVLTGSPAMPEPDPTPEPTQTSAPTATPTEEPTDQPTPTPTITSTSQPTATLMPPPQPTATPSPPPTVPPANDNDDDDDVNENDDNDNEGNENENENDNDNDNGDAEDNANDNEGSNDNDNDNDDDNSGSGSNDNDSSNDNDGDDDDD